jgi:hypothetical protein
MALQILAKTTVLSSPCCLAHYSNLDELLTAFAEAGVKNES